MSNEPPNMTPVGEYIVGTLIHAGIVKPGDAALAVKIVEEELGVWLAIRDFNSPPKSN